MKKKTLLIMMIIALLVLAGCGGGNGNVKKANTKEDVKAMAEEFYQGFENADPVSITTYVDGEKESVFAKDGDKYYQRHEEADADYYSFLFNEKHYLITDGYNAYEDEFMYPMYESMLELYKTMYLTGIFESDDAEDTLKYSAVRTEKEDGSELVYTASGDVDGMKVDLSVTGTKGTDGKLKDVLYVVETDGQKSEFRFEMAYDTSIDLPDYMIEIDPSDFDWVYEVIDSPYETIGDLLDTLDEEEFISSLIEENDLYTYGWAGDRYCQFKAAMSDDELAAFDALDIFDDDYEEKKNAILADLAITECLDLTANLLTKEETDGYIGKRVEELIEAGFEESGWFVSEEESAVFVNKGPLTYLVPVQLPEGFDTEAEIEFTDLYDAVVTGFTFNELQFYALPIR